jgi:creatinine amidohydrolase
MTVDPKMVRMEERVKAGKFAINGIDLAPVEKIIAIGKEVVAYRAEITTEAIKKICISNWSLPAR